MRKETKRLYFEDPYQVEFEAQVSRKIIHEQKPALILDQSCFYPESGGQPCDKGQIDGINVLKVVEDKEEVLHLVEKDVSSKKIKGKIDWERRFDHMQQHSGQHILSQSFYEFFEAETLSFHLGIDSSTVEMDLRTISEEEIEKVEERANDIIFQNREVKSYFIPEEKIKSLPFRKPPQKEGLIRVVEVSDFDYSACGGTHVRRAGEIGLIKILKGERIRNNVRLEFTCGKRAFEDYSWKSKALYQLSGRFSAHERDVLTSVEKLLSDLKSQKRINRKLQEKMTGYLAQEFIGEAKGNIIKQIFTDKKAEEVKYLALNIINKGDFVVLFGIKGEERGHLVFACSQSLNIDMREIVPAVSSLIKGKGGGSPALVEVAGEGVENLELALSKAEEYVKQKMQ
jgi:alanyl-tRNA synthetase